MKIWLRYTNAATPISARLDAAIFEERVNAEREKFSSLKKRRYSFLLSKRKAYYVELGADELQDAAKKTFMDNFFTGELLYLSLDNTATVPPDGNFFPVVIEEDGDAPLTWLENSTMFPEYAITLTEVIGV